MALIVVSMPSPYGVFFRLGSSLRKRLSSSLTGVKLRISSVVTFPGGLSLLPGNVNSFTLRLLVPRVVNSIPGSGGVADAGSGGVGDEGSCTINVYLGEKNE